MKTNEQAILESTLTWENHKKSMGPVVRAKFYYFDPNRASILVSFRAELIFLFFLSRRIINLVFYFCLDRVLAEISGPFKLLGSMRIISVFKTDL